MRLMSHESNLRCTYKILQLNFKFNSWRAHSSRCICICICICTCICICICICICMCICICICIFAHSHLYLYVFIYLFIFVYILYISGSIYYTLLSLIQGAAFGAPWIRLGQTSTAVMNQFSILEGVLQWRAPWIWATPQKERPTMFHLPACLRSRRGDALNLRR